jgi:hypothetical protein
VSQEHAARLTDTHCRHTHTHCRHTPTHCAFPNLFCNTGLEQGQAADEASRRVAHVFADAVQGHAAPGSLALVSFDNIGSLLTILGLSLHAIRSRFSSLALGAVTP